VSEAFGNTALVKVEIVMILRLNEEKGRWRINGVIKHRQMRWKIVGS